MTVNNTEVNEENITTVIADDLEVTGSIKFKSSLMLKGLFDGEILSEGLLIIGPTAKVKATITTKNLISHGEVTGDVIASEQVVLKNTSVHNGNITTPDLNIESGAAFNGSCLMKVKDINISQ
ncbi:MAG: polymer-forming cytoskeletal protein [Proteobacteria bacterium]|nr:polymer-forming cytoskeletal protein [Pseudomonadota bacterium]